MKSYRQFAESVEGDELYLFITNHSQLYRQRLQPIYKNAVTKMARDQYDSKKAVKLFMYAVDDGAKLYILKNSLQEMMQGLCSPKM